MHAYIYRTEVRRGIDSGRLPMHNALESAVRNAALLAISAASATTTRQASLAGVWRVDMMARSPTRRVLKWVGPILTIAIIITWAMSGGIGTALAGRSLIVGVHRGALYGAWNTDSDHEIGLYYGGWCATIESASRTYQRVPPWGYPDWDGESVSLVGFTWPTLHSGKFYDCVTVPLWCPIVVFMLWSAVLWWREYHPYRRGRCQKCGYDLMGNVSGRCPECGSATES